MHGVPYRMDHRAPNGRFRNPWPAASRHRFGDFLRWRRQRFLNPPPPPPPAGALPSATPSFASPRADTGVLTATWVGHSTVLVQMGGLNILTDPIWSNRASPLQAVGPRRIVPPAMPLASLPPLDLVLLSHNHYDHLDAGTVRALASQQPDALWMAPLGLQPLLHRFGVQRVAESDWWQERAVGDARIAGTPAQHFSARHLADARRTLWCGWSVRVAGHALWFAGDTAYHPEFGAIGERFGPFDLSLIPIGAYEPRWFMRPVHMNPEESVQAFLDANTPAGREDQGIMLGLHWGTFLLADEPWDEPPARTRAAWNAAGLPAQNLWILQHGETRRAATS